MNFYITTILREYKFIINKLKKLRGSATNVIHFD